jgi:hypothetical protein
MRVRDTAHYGNLFVAIVGETSDGRKGHALDSALAFMRNVDEGWSHDRISGGFASGEGLIMAVRDPQEVRRGKDGVETLPGVDDKRLFIAETEFAKVLDTAHRQGSILSSVLRQAYDGGDLSNLSKNSPVRATGAHVSVLAHITPDELRAKLMGSLDTVNGFANRFVFVASRRSRLLPFGGARVEWQDLAHRLAGALDISRRRGVHEVTFDPEAREIWEAIYPKLANNSGGLLGAITARASAHVLRLALVYAATEGADMIGPTHLAAALAVWHHSAASARWLFGGASTGSTLADRVLSVLLDTDAKDGWVNKRDLFKRFSHRPAWEMDKALERLQSRRLVAHERPKSGPSGGRPPECWRAL